MSLTTAVMLKQAAVFLSFKGGISGVFDQLFLFKMASIPQKPLVICPKFRYITFAYNIIIFYDL